MRNIQGVWLPCFSVNFTFFDDGKQMTAAGKHGIAKGNAEISQPRNSENALTLKCKLKIMLLWGRCYAL